MATVLQTLARDVGILLAEHLTPAARTRDRVTLAVLLLFSGQSPRSQYYRWNLLFRDFSGQEPDQEIPLPNGKTATIPAEAVRYVDEVLWLRRLTLANNLKERPGNIHLLLERGCQLHAEPEPWGTAGIARATAEPTAGPALGRTAKVLAQQCNRLGEDYGDISKRRRVEFGPLWLSVGGDRTEVPEEMSLDNVIDAAPLPLQPGFQQDKEFAKRLLRVIEALNERYMQLRACGLKPEIWLGQERPSINQLAELRSLRLAVQRLEQQGIALVPAYQQAFAEGLAEAGGKKLGGFTSFEEFFEDAVGVEMTRRGSMAAVGERGRQTAFASDDDAEDERMLEADEEDDADSNDDAGDEQEDGFYPEELDEELDIKKTFTSLPNLFPHQFTPVMRHYFQKVLALGGEPERQNAALSDPEFQAAVAADARYRDLTGDGLQQALFQDAETLIQRNATKWRSCW
ncbi:MAG: hypothetical protein FIA97_17740 [Methylococcaceae bacterium]|nr:hypothetical protein [Methylococcaceae bacterium]